MSKIAFYFPGNGMHSFLIEDRWKRMYDEKMGLDVIGRSGIPVTTSHQKLDYHLFPFLAETLNRYPSISVAGAPFAHPIFFMAHAKHRRWELNEHQFAHGTLPITFFPEFATPDEGLIPTEFFFHLASQTTCYSALSGEQTEDSVSVEAIDPLAVGVRYGSRIGIVLDGFQSFNRAWFNYAARPTEATLDCVMSELERLIASPRPFTVIPIDLEQPWVGSVRGASVLEVFFDALKRRGLDRHIIPMMEVLEAARQTTQSITRPYRVLTKWTSHEVQIDKMMKLKSFEPRGQKQHMLYAIAAGSDRFSSLNRSAVRKIAPVKPIKGLDSSGQTVDISQAHHAVLQDVCSAAERALDYPEQSFADRLQKLETRTAFSDAVLDWARREGL